MRKILYIPLLFIGLLCGSEVAFGQFVEFKAIPQQKFKAALANQQSRISNTALIPFWDDFSQGLDTLAWDFDGVIYSETIGNNLPSFGALVFDGVDASGRPYSREVRDQGFADLLTSQEFDLTPLDVNTLTLTFFWQAGGKAELPDENDRLVLQFLDADSLWTTVWSVNGGIERDSENFTRETISVEAEYFHENFKFRFYNEARLSGPFDAWIVDYILLTPTPTGAPPSISDRALTQPNQFLIGNYGAIPYFLLDSFSAENFSPISNEFFNLENRFRAMEYSVFVGDAENTIPINQNTPFNPVPNASERRAFISNDLSSFEKFESETELILETYLTTGDREFFTILERDTTFYSNIDLRANDTVRSTFPLRDYLAYDTGNPDYAAGINQRSGELVVRYEIPQSLYIQGISINFTDPSQADQPIDILIYQDLDEPAVYREEVLVPRSENGSLAYFPIDTTIQVTEEFYIGFAQFTNEFIHVGLDKNNDQGEEIFYNVRGAWAQNEEVRGALMIRPHLSLTSPFGDAELPDSELRIYPNPVSTILTVEADILYSQLFDSFGREILPAKEVTTKGEIINFTGQKSGVYVLHVMTPSGLKTKRILVK